jgi:hypothetical protein
LIPIPNFQDFGKSPKDDCNQLFKSVLRAPSRLREGKTFPMASEWRLTHCEF